MEGASLKLALLPALHIKAPLPGYYGPYVADRPNLPSSKDCKTQLNKIRADLEKDEARGTTIDKFKLDAAGFPAIVAVKTGAQKIMQAFGHT